jgi:hypothetical protein
MYPRLLLSLPLTWLLACQSPTSEKARLNPPAADSVAATAHPAPTPAPAQAAAPAARTEPPLSTEAYPYYLPPVDETQRDPELRAFVRRVLRACAAQQPAELLALIDESVMVSYGGGIEGKQGFVDEFLNSPTKGAGYQALQEMIGLGGTATRDSTGRLTATFPYLQDERLYQRNRQLAQLSVDPYVTYVGTKPGVSICQRPDRRSRVLRRLDYPVLLTAYDAPELPAPWLRVTAADSSFRGYADGRQLYCLAGPTLTIEYKRGRYCISSVAVYD